MSDRSRSGPCLILLKGHPGCGKSTLAHRIASLLRCPLIDKDDARDSLHPLAISNPEMDLNAISYDIMLSYVTSQLRLNINVLCDSPLARIELFHRAIAITRELHSARVIIIEVECKDEETWKQRLEARGREEPLSHKPKTWDELQALIKSYNGAHLWLRDIQVDQLRVPFELLQVDTSSEESISQLLDHLRGEVGSEGGARGWI